MEMRLNHFFAERLQRSSRRNDLHQDIRTIDVGFNHFFDSLNLAFDSTQPDDEGSFLQPTANVLRFHEGTLTPFAPDALLEKAIDTAWGIGVYGMVISVKTSNLFERLQGALAGLQTHRELKRLKANREKLLQAFLQTEQMTPAIRKWSSSSK